MTFKIRALFSMAAILILSSQVLAQKERLFETIEQRGEAAWERAKQIWAWAEPGYQESKSSKLLADDLAAAGSSISIIRICFSS